MCKSNNTLCISHSWNSQTISTKDSNLSTSFHKKVPISHKQQEAKEANVQAFAAWITIKYPAKLQWRNIIALRLPAS